LYCSNENTIQFFELTDLAVNTYCIANKSEVCEHYKIYWIADGSGTYQIDFQEFSIEGSGIFCLSPKQVFTVKSEKVKTAYQIAFDKDFYCIETHGKEIACNGLLFNNVHRATAVSVGENDKKKFQGFIDLMIAEIESKGDAHKDMLESYLRMFLIQTLRLVDKQELKISEITHSKDRTVQEFIALVDKHFKEEHTVAGYAEKLFITPKSLAKKLNSLKYPTPLQVIKDRIMLDAKRQLF